MPQQDPDAGNKAIAGIDQDVIPRGRRQRRGAKIAKRRMALQINGAWRPPVRQKTGLRATK